MRGLRVPHPPVVPATWGAPSSPPPQPPKSHLGGRVFPASQRPCSPHPGRKPWGNEFYLHTHSDRRAFTSRGLGHKSMQDTGAFFSRIPHQDKTYGCVWGMQCQPHVHNIQQPHNHWPVKSIPLDSIFILKKRSGSFSSLLAPNISSCLPFPPSLHWSIPELQRWWTTSIVETSQNIFLSSAEDADLLLYFLLSLSTYFNEIYLWVKQICIASSSSEHRWSAQVSVTSGSLWRLTSARNDIRTHFCIY